MRPWLLPWKAEALLVALMVVGCGSTHPLLRPPATGASGEVLIHIPHTATVEPVELKPEEVRQTIRRLAREVQLSGSPRETVEKLFQLDALYGNYLYLNQERKLVPAADGMPLEGLLTEDEQFLADGYKGWCRRAHHFHGDCLGGALVAGKYLDMRGRYMWAMALSKSPVLEEFEKALGEMVSMRAVIQAAMGTIVVLLLLLALPEPVTKFIAAWATAALVVWVGAKTLYNLITGWFQLMKEVQVATTFEQIREAGEKFGRLFSREAAQAFAMIAVAVLTYKAKDFAEQVATLPGSSLASMQAADEAGFMLSEVSAVQSVTVTAEGFLVALPPFAVAMASQGRGRGGRVENHHIGTIRNKKSALRGGPWTQRFEKLFARAGMRLSDAENIVPIQGHKGPHPEQYHQIVYKRLRDALGDCSTMVECRRRLVPALDELARKIATPGTELNRLVTLGK